MNNWEILFAHIFLWRVRFASIRFAFYFMKRYCYFPKINWPKFIFIYILDKNCSCRYKFIFSNDPPSPILFTCAILHLEVDNFWQIFFWWNTLYVWTRWLLTLVRTKYSLSCTNFSFFRTLMHNHGQVKTEIFEAPASYRPNGLIRSDSSGSESLVSLTNHKLYIAHQAKFVILHIFQSLTNTNLLLAFFVLCAS